MRAFLYYATHSLLNTIKKLMKTWVAIIIVMLICGGLIGGITAMVDNIKSGGKQDTAVTEVDDKDVVVSDEDGEVVAEYEFNTGSFKDFFKKNNIVNGRKCGQDESAVIFAVDGSAVAFETFHGGIAVQPHHKAVAEFAGLCQVGDVAAVKHVETAVGEDHLPILPVKFLPAADWDDF